MFLQHFLVMSVEIYTNLTQMNQWGYKMVYATNGTHLRHVHTEKPVTLTHNPNPNPNRTRFGFL